MKESIYKLRWLKSPITGEDYIRANPTTTIVREGQHKGVWKLMENEYVRLNLDSISQCRGIPTPTPH